MPTKPTWFSIRNIKKSPQQYVENLNKKESIELAIYLDYQYHEKNKQVVEDEVYDILKDSIEERWPKAAYLKQVGHKVVTKGRKEVVLPIFMPSLSKIKPETKGVEDFIRSMLVLSEKLDGISLLLEYYNGRPIACYTRGDGTKGQDVSGVIPALNIPKQIPVKEHFYVRCEFLIAGKSFSSKHAASTGKGKYKTARNMGGGLLTRNEPSAAVKDFDVVAYEIAKGKGAGTALSQQLSTLKRMGFTVVKHKKYSGLSLDKLIELHSVIKAKSKYELDGIVVTQDTSYRIGKANPKHAKAFKINSLESSLVVKVKDVVWKRSRHGKWIPRVEVDPIQLGGVTVTYFTGHNYFFIQNGFSYKDRNKELPVRPINKGAMIRVIRSGDVIPYIMEVVKPARKASVPNADYVLDTNGVQAMDVRVKGSGLDDTQKMQRIVHFFSAMKMKGVKAGIIEKLYSAGFRTLRSILHAPPEKLLRAEGVKEKTAENVVKTIQLGLSNATFARVAYASSIFGDKIGESKLQAIIDDIPNVVQLADKLSPLQLQERIEEIPGIKTQAGVIARRMPKFLLFLERNRIKLVGEVKQVAASNRLAGFKVLFTSVRDEELMQDIISNGGSKASSVRSATHLVVKPGASNNKTEQAEELGLPVLTVEQFRKKFKL